MFGILQVLGHPLSYNLSFPRIRSYMDCAGFTIVSMGDILQVVGYPEFYPVVASLSLDLRLRELCESALTLRDPNCLPIWGMTSNMILWHFT